MEALFRLLPGPQPVLVRYGLTSLFVLIGFALRAGSSEITGPYGFLFSYCQSSRRRFYSIAGPGCSRSRSAQVS
jgi:hypothetical protein